MLNAKRLRDCELAYVIRDCQKTIAAMPEGMSLERYVRDMRACQQEQGRRATVRLFRKRLRMVGDWLTTPISQCRRRRDWHKASYCTIDSARMAGWRLACMNRYGC